MLNKFEIRDIISKCFEFIEEVCSGNGYKSTHTIDIESSRFYDVFTITTTDNQGETWQDVFTLTHKEGDTFVGNADYQLTNGNNNDTCLMSSKEKYQTEIIGYVLSQIYQYKADSIAREADINTVYERYLAAQKDKFTVHKDEVEAEIKRLKEKAESAYDRYMYEEAAELNYNAEASRKAFSVYCNYKAEAEYLENKLTNNQGE